MRYLMLMWADADATSGDESDFQAWAEFDAQVKAAGAFVLNGALTPVLLAQVGGNPLFAEQYAQMLAEHGAGRPPPVPESIQGIIAARLDLPAPAEKRLLQGAAVIGKVFWPGAVTALADLTGHPSAKPA
jgi:hypothetical protein